MKKALAILTTVGITTTASLSVVACGKTNTLYDKFRSYVDETKGSYNADGNPLTKSSSAIIYLGAKDNASSQSFEYALSHSSFADSLDQAKAALSYERKVTTTSPVILENIQVGSPEAGEHAFFVPDDATIAPLKGTDLIKTKIDNEIYEAQITDQGDGQIKIAFESIVKPADKMYDQLELTGYKPDPINIADDIISNWTTAYNNWLSKPNGDRDITGIDLNLDPNSEEFGKVNNIQKNDPVYGITGGQTDRLLINAYDYSKLQLSLKTVIVDKVADYWNSDFFKSLINSYLKTDIMYQLTANEKPNPGNEDHYQTRQKAVENYLTSVKAAKGPLFLVIKNGHLIKIMKGWNRYDEFGGKDTPGSNNSNSNLKAWIGEIATIFASSFKDNNRGLFTIDGTATEVVNWSFVASDDNGASNWDVDKQEPIS